MKKIKKILYVGLKPGLSLQFRRTIILTNAIALIGSFLSSIMLVYLLFSCDWEWSLTSGMVLATIVVLLLVLLANKFQKFKVSRFVLSILIPVMSITISMLPRIDNPHLYQYQPRSPALFCIVLVTSVIPLMVFSIREVKFFAIALGINLLGLILIDPMLFTFSADYTHEGYTTGRYLGNNIVIFIAELFLIGNTIFLKSLFEYFEKENESLIQGLNAKNDELKSNNRELFQLNRNIEIQNQEIIAQSEELMQSQGNLVTANREIERQKLELEKKNTLLEQSLDAKNKDLLHSNQQLVVQNHDLHQFSDTVSHNLRGPLASMLGLIHIHELSTDVVDKARIFSLLGKSVQSMENVIHDLNKIIDIRRDKFNISEKLSLEKEARLIIQSLYTFIIDNDVSIKLDFKVDEIVLIKAYINSILYNLISNAIQYRSPNRKPVINVSSHRKSDLVVIEVADNGLGIDLDRYGGDLFKLYKRFHTQVEGKGLGLYIVKQQVEKLNGRIEVESKPDMGSRFSVFLKVAESN